MKRLSIAAALVLSSLLFGVCPLYAESSAPWQVNLDGGLSMPVGSMDEHGFSVKSSDFLKNSGAIRGGAFYQATDWIAAGMEAQYSLGHNIDGHTDFNGPGYVLRESVSSDVDVHVFHLGPSVKIGPRIATGGATVRPYLIANIGWSHVWWPDGTGQITLSDNFGNSLSSPSLPIAGHSDDYFGLQGGGGIEWLFSNNVVLGLEARYYRFFAGSGTFRPTSQDGQFVIPTARIGFLFGAPRTSSSARAGNSSPDLYASQQAL